MTERTKRPWLCRLWHALETVQDNGKTLYEQCARCGDRRAWQRPGGYQPINMEWIEASRKSSEERKT